MRPTNPSVLASDPLILASAVLSLGAQAGDLARLLRDSDPVTYHLLVEVA